MLAKSMMVLGKLLMVVTFINPAYADSWNKPIYQNELAPISSGNIIYNTYRNLFSRLNKEDSLKHQQAVFFALNRLDNGETSTWYSEDGYRTGRATVMLTATLNGETCRRVFSVITLKSEQRSFEEWACFKTNTNTWAFSDK